MKHAIPAPALAITLVAFIIALLTIAPVAAGGRGEDTAVPPEEAPAVEAPDAPSTTDDGESAPGNPSATIPMDDATADLVAAMGMMPFEEKIPSEDFELDLLWRQARHSLSEHRQGGLPELLGDLVPALPRGDAFHADPLR